MRTTKNKALILFMIITFLGPMLNSAFAQNKNDSSVKTADPFQQMLNYSRPGEYHQLLADLAGTWNWKAKNYEGNLNPDSNKLVREPNGSLVRKPFAGGRFFITELASGQGQTLQSPIQDGKMQEDNFKSMVIEGYDNVKRRFVKSFINNHVGSCIVSYEGNYDSATKTIIYKTEVETMPGMKWKIDEHLIFIDNNHYRTEDYIEVDGKLAKTGDTNYTRVKGK